MTVNQATFSILITTKNRKSDLAFTLSKIKYLLDRDDVECVVFDDGSVDGTYEFIKENFSSIQLRRNSVSKGLIFCRNKMLNETKATYAISLDDDAHFVTQNPLESILYHFEHNANCGLIAFRIFWGLEEPNSIVSNEENEQVQGYVGCAHVWRMSAWRTIPNYPEWFVFYGEENFASYQLYKKNWKVLYVPQVLVNHRVELQSRKNNADFGLRLRQSLRSGWYLMLLFYPMYIIPKKIIFTLWVQLKSKVFKGNFKALKAILYALFDLVLAIPKIVKNSNRLTKKEYETYCKLPKTKVYW